MPYTGEVEGIVYSPGGRGLLSRLIPVDPIKGEEWREIPGLEGTGYEASNLGRVRSVVLMVGGRDRRGYPTVSLRRATDGFGEHKSPHWNTHVLVARAFLGRRPTGLEVNHKDGCLTNNRLDNLEYVTHVENVQHAHRLGLIDYKKISAKLCGRILSPETRQKVGRTQRERGLHRGESNPAARLTEVAVRQIRHLRERGMTQMAIAARFGVSQFTVWRIVSGVGWAHVR